MSQKTENQRTTLDLIEEHDDYLLQSLPEIRRVLVSLIKKPDIVTCYFNGGKEYLLTSVLTVLSEKGLVVLDNGPVETTNRRALSFGRLVCVANHNNVPIRFNLSGLKRARLKGDPVFAAPIPEKLYRVQRREFFRIDTPVLTRVMCRIPLEEGPLELEVADISCGGVGLSDPDMEFKPEAHQILEHCVIEIPEVGVIEVDLEVRNVFPQRQRDGSEVLRIGCAFGRLTMEQNAIIQRYINKLQINRKGIK